MRIENLRPVGVGSVVARFNLVVTDEMTVLDMALKRNGAGHLRVYPPGTQKMLLSMAPALQARVTAAAVAALEGVVHDRAY